MNALLEALMNPGSMSSSQWLLVALMLFVAAGGAYFVYRLYRIIMTERKSTYVPNIGRKRLEAEARDQRRPGAGAASNGVEQDKIQ